MWDVGFGPRNAIFIFLLLQENKLSVYFLNALVWERAKLSSGSRVAGEGRQRQIFAEFVNEVLFHFLINICLDIIWGKPAQTTAMWEIPLLFSSCQLLVWRWRGKEERPRQRERVREFASNLKKVTGFCLDLAEDGMSWASQCTYGPCDGSKRLNSSAFLADIQETVVALREKIISL